MKRIAIIGGGIAGVSAAYELALQQRAGAPIGLSCFKPLLAWAGLSRLYARDDFVMECGPDSWVTEKPWARDLAIELGLKSALVPSQDDRRKTYIAEGRTLTAMPDGMRMMVPTQWASVLNSPLFSWQAKLAYLREAKLAETLKASALNDSNSKCDESVRDFVSRHFGGEVADTIAAPLLAGVFGGDIATLSVRAVMPAFVALEREHGSLILGLQKWMRAGNASASVFTTLRRGLAGLIDGMESHIPARNICAGLGSSPSSGTVGLVGSRNIGSGKNEPGARNIRCSVGCNSSLSYSKTARASRRGYWEIVAAAVLFRNCCGLGIHGRPGTGDANSSRLWISGFTSWVTR